MIARFKHPLFLTFLLGALILALYSVSLGHNFLFDEENIILHNRFIKDFSLLPELFKHGYFPFEEKSDLVWNIYYRPLTSLTFAADYFFWKANPLGYNIVNMLLHFGVCALLFFFLRKTIKHDLGAFLATLLYAMHTAHTEAVTYIASRGDLLGGLFLLLALHAYWENRLGRTLLFYFLGLFSKESVLLLPIYLMVLDFSFKRGTVGKTANKLWPFILLAVSFLVFRKYFSPAPLGPPTQDWGEAALRFFSMGPAFLSYLSAIVAPETFKFCASVDFAKHWNDPKIYLSLFILTILLAGWGMALKRRGPAFFGMTFFLVSFLPSLQIIHYHPEWAEHYLYLPGMGLTLLLGLGIKNIFLSEKKMLLAIFLLLYLPFLVFIGCKTWQRNVIYNDTDGYYERLATSDSPYASYGYGYKARVAIEEERWEDAIVPLKTANAMNPKQHMVYDWMGLYYFQKNDLETALQNFEKTYEYCSFRNSKHLVKVAMTLFQMGRIEESAKIYEKIQSEHPKEVDLYTNLLMSYELLGNVEKAKHWAQIGIKELQGKESDEVLLRMVYARMAYRQGWDEVVRQEVDEVLRDYPDIFWYGDVARLLRGEMDQRSFEQLLLSKYQGEEFKVASRFYCLMALVLNGEETTLASYAQENFSFFEKTVEERRLFRKEWDRAKESLEKKVS